MTLSLPTGGVTNLGWSLVALAALAGVLLDRLLGEVPRWHPLRSEERRVGKECRL